MDAEQRADRHALANLQPGLELLEAPVVHADLAAVTALSAGHQDRSAARVEIKLGQIKRLLDAQASAPEHDDNPRARRP
jgi:hypothetical protein